MPPQPLSGLNGPLLLEEPLIRTPYELLRRSHRSAQRQVEKDFLAIQAALSSLAKSLAPGSAAAPSDSTVAEHKALALAKLEQAGDRIRGLKRKLDDLQPSAAAPSVLRDRIAYVDNVLMNPAADQAERDKTLDRYIIDHLLRTGRMKTARTLAKSQGVEHLVDTKLFAELVRIEEALVVKHSCSEALAWCGENRGTLKKLNSNLEFVLRLQEFIELCRKRDTTGAIAYARKNLSGWAHSHLVELQQGMTLLAFGETTGVALYRKLYDRSRWTSVRDQFRQTFLNLYALPSQSLLALALSAGLSSLRVPGCALDSEDEDGEEEDGTHTPTERSRTVRAADTLTTLFSTSPTSTVRPLLPPAPPWDESPIFARDSASGTDIARYNALVPAVLDLSTMEAISESDYDSPSLRGGGTARVGAVRTGAPGTTPATPPHPDPSSLKCNNVDCPTCNADMRILASEVPMAHHVNSTLVCRISGKVMDSDNLPKAFPNGFVYSAKALDEMAANNFGVVTCPRTGETCSKERLRTVYIS